MLRQLILFGLLLCSINSVRADFLFQKIVDTTNVNSFITGSFNDSGQVAYWSRTNGVDAVRVWNAATLATSTVATANTATGNFLGFRPILNNLGIAAYTLNTNLQGNQVLTTNLATNQTQQTLLFGGTGEFATINDAGTLAYTVNTGNGYTVWVAPVGGPTTSPGSSSIGAVVLNNNGQLLRQSGNTMLLNGTALNDAFVGVLAFPSMNNLGEVAYYGIDNRTAQPASIYKDTIAGSPILAVDGTLFTGLSRPMINDAGLIAFTGIRNGTRGLYLNGERVLQVGDTLDGGTITDLGLGFRSLSNSNQVVFTAVFADGRQGMFLSSVSSVPEPSTVLLFSMLTMAGAARFGSNRWMKKKSAH